MKRYDRKSACPINFCLEAFGDPWSLLIVRDIIFRGSHTFKEFLASDERITTSVLSARLADLEKHGILEREPHPTDGRRDNYVLTEKGLALIPMLLDMMEWGTANDPRSAGHRMPDFMSRVRKQRGTSIKRIVENVKKGKTAFD